MSIPFDNSQGEPDALLDSALRPKKWDDYVGQEKIKENIRVILTAAKQRSQSPDHLLLYGNSGLGKTTLANLVALEMGKKIRITTGPAIERAGDLAAILTNLQEGDVLFLDEIHRIHKTVEEYIYPAMEEYKLNLILGKGPMARTMELKLPHFTLIGATTRPGLLSAPLRNRFGATFQLNFYNQKDIEKIVERSATILGIQIQPEAIAAIGARSRFTPRVANRLLKRARDFAQVEGLESITKDIAEHALESLEVDHLGLEPGDKKILLALIEKFGGGPVGLQSLAAAAMEEEDTILDIYEPYLMQCGLIERTPKGRVATRLAECVRQNDTVARLGGDEFTVLLMDISRDEDAGKVAEKIIHRLETPFQLQQHELFITTSIGISVYPKDGEETDTLLKHADAAMYRAKEHGKNNYQFYSAAINDKAVRRLALENKLHYALGRDEFRLYYQPIVNISNGCISGVEALLRWQEPELGLVTPDEFVPILEETGLIVPVGEWIMHTACTQAQAWQTNGPVQLKISINISGRQFDRAHFYNSLQNLLEITGLPPQMLVLELTESIIMSSAPEAIKAMNALRAAGIRLAVDDFGTGYSSLAYLKRFPINALKIDIEFIRDVVTNPEDAAIVNAIIVMAHSLGIQAIAEGVETPEQLAFLRAHDCDAFQGYLFSKPVPAEEISQLMLETPCLIGGKSK